MSQKVNKLVRELFALDNEIEKADQQINKMKARRHMLSTVDLPEVMTEIGSSYTELDDGSGLVCSVDHKVYGSLPSRDHPDARMAAIDYLKEHDGAELIRANVLVSFGKGDISSANRMRRMLIQKTNQPVTVDAEVHHSSLAAWARARIKANLPTNMDIVGLRGLTLATVKRTKA